MMSRIFGVSLLVAIGFTSLVTGASAPPGHYTISSGTVFDTRTRLTWQQSVPAATFTLASAGAYCAGLGTGWRLPTIRELETIVDYSVAPPGPTIDAAAFPNTPTNLFYVTSTLVNGSSLHWSIDFSNGVIGNNAGEPFNVRCAH
jgi:Protein of unknown function (DUF1566)